jgi:precorrin-6Y C5,15-methyltransferase (decarboxylating)
MSAWLTVVGIGDDGFAGLGRPARRALLEASVIYGGERHLSMLPARLAARRAEWPRPFDLAPLLAERGSSVCVLASGDPMLFGVGATLARQLPASELRVLPAPSSLSLAAARLGWPLQDVATVSLVGRPLPMLNAYLHDRARVFVLSADGRTPAVLADLLNARGFGATRMTVLEHLGGDDERRIDGRADQWSPGDVAALNLVALECRATEGAPRLPLTCGLPDDAFRHDGQLTKRDVRAIRFIEHNRDALGVPGLQLVAARAPQALEGLAAPHAVFIGGGVTVPGVLETCWDNLRAGGRLVANAVTLQGEAALAAWRDKHGGTLTRIALADAQPLGGFDTWRQALPITLYDVVKRCAADGVHSVADNLNAASSA